MAYQPTVNPFPDEPILRGEVIRDVDFPDPLEVRVYPREPFNGDGHFQLVSEYRMLFQLSGENFHRTIAAPIGMMHDFASIPEALWGLPSFKPHEGPHVPASIIHDYLFLCWSDWRDQASRDDFYFANRIFSAGMHHFGTKRHIRSGMFNAVNSEIGWETFRDCEPFAPLMAKWEGIL